MPFLRLFIVASLLYTGRCYGDRAAAGASPTYTNPQPLFTFPADTEFPLAQLLGFDLSADGQPVTSATPSAKEGSVLRIDCVWTPLSALVDAATLRVVIQSSGPRIEKDLKLPATGWIVGERYRSPIELELPKYHLVGNSALTLRLAPPDMPLNEAPVVYRGALLVAPVARLSEFDQALLDTHFGGNARRIGRKFRLAPGATLSLPVPRPDTGVAGLGIVSALSYSTAFVQGLRIVHVLATDDVENETQAVFVCAGVSTAVSDYDQARPGALRHDKIQSIASIEEPKRRTWNNQPFQNHYYVGRLAFQAAMRPTRLDFTYLPGEGMIEFLDVLLLSSSDETGAVAP